uniref:Uncharacterized protein n=1 Tax=viral metagenome TaxID=1070528 RepID=A0A6C0ISS4_9ZZZZ
MVICKDPDCKVRASFNNKGETPLYCGTHRSSGMVNVISKICEHGKRKSYCKECKGSQICEHDKRKDDCKQCGGNSYCIHGKWKTICKECKGSEICEHGKVRYSCKDCGGSQICEHGKHKRICKECNPKGFCKHGKQKQQCRDCGGSQICEHGKQKFNCRECGNGLCKHNKNKYSCRECGTSLCKHNKNKYSCRECGGSAFCEHGIRKARCRDCGGSDICEHGKQKARCRDCGGSSLCKNDWCTTYANKKYDNYCLYCYMHMFPDKPVAQNYKTKEAAVAEYIKSKYSQFEWRTDRRIQDGCSRRRPDLLLDLGYQVIIIEIDENQHTDYDCSCENKRTMELSQDVGHRPIVFIRFNPDDYVDGGKKVSSCWGLNKLCICTVKKTKKNEWTERLHALSSQVDYWIDENNKTDKTIEIVQMFYDR